ncbi:xanthine dehydrogenase family protein molybdopterin-binding subunit [Paracraurococcus lichenis]|uniref:Xanthine dehydrogenase family protein molybdopterin-binding subunit n=1 Tax=Paracraurococcus lichenis TaxID=3064888 RepID=A0ABT9E0H8_9PROT|nr:xanthine dehydrogenase family protein molybdopterin-binding subunit [Paracraurococcus sp. LOR1-02]MDO9709660.1 xanthine dehydrogenase family protein molybdopterin-binding subunit [Paracraurococcus sp. LOR1-02]
MIGENRRRLEDARFLTGQGRYIADLVPAEALHAHVLRSPHAHARILAVDVAAARAMPGVALVLTGADLAAEGIGPLPCPAVVQTIGPLIVPDRPAIARDAVKHVGEPVALVVAATPAEARDAAEAIAVDYEPLPAVVGSRAALTPGAPQLWPEAPGNRAFRFERGDRAAMEAGFARAARIVELDLINHRVHAAPLEPRGAVARCDGARFDLEFAGMGVHAIRRQLATVFGLPETAFHLRCPDVGGGFGMKNFLFPEHVALLAAARRLGRPVAWIAEHTEEFQGAVHARDFQGTARLALDGEGRFLALHARMAADMGAYCSAFGPAVPTNSVSTAIGGIYAIPAILLEVEGAFTNSVPTDAYRGAGKPEANYLTERLVEAAGHATGIDPVELRRRNAIAAFPYRSATGMLMDTGRMRDNLADLGALLDREGFAARRAASEARGLLRGLGIAAFLETSRGAPHEWAAVRFAPDGMVDLCIGTQNNGQGLETSFVQVAAAWLGLEEARFRIVQADTDRIAFGNGHGGARSLHVGATALVMAMEKVLAKARRIAAYLLQVAPESLEFTEGCFTVTATGAALTLDALIEASHDPRDLPDGMEPGLDAEAMNLSDLVTFPSGAHCAEVEIDPETGAVTLCRYQAVDDYGALVNPMLTRGQVQGGLAQGIGQALLERIAYDPASGQLLSASFMDYGLPRAADLPALEIAFGEAPTHSNPLGVKGVGQAGAIAAPQTVLNAVLDALRPLGVAHLQMPATAENVWRAIRAARG